MARRTRRAKSSSRSSSGSPPSFPLHFWETGALVELLRIEFLSTSWRTDVKVAAPPGPTDTRLEVMELLVLKQTERAAHLRDIEAQAANSIDYYQRMMMFSERSHPKTFLLLQACIGIGRSVIMHYKSVFQRARPAQLEAELLPPIPTPGHASYPSGHSFQQHLEMRLLQELVPAQSAALAAFAWDVAVNRERAGLHYRSDSEAGQQLAADIWPILSAGALFKQTMAEARREW